MVGLDLFFFVLNKSLTYFQPIEEIQVMQIQKLFTPIPVALNPVSPISVNPLPLGREEDLVQRFQEIEAEYKDIANKLEELEKIRIKFFIV